MRLSELILGSGMSERYMLSSVGDRTSFWGTHALMFDCCMRCIVGSLVGSRLRMTIVVNFVNELVDVDCVECFGHVKSGEDFFIRGFFFIETSE